MSTNSLIDKKVSVGFRYVNEMGATEGIVVDQNEQGLLVRVKKNLMFYPWTSIVYVRVDE